MYIDDLDDFLRGLIDLLVTVILVLFLLVVVSLSDLGLVEALLAHHSFKVLVSSLRVHQKLIAAHERFFCHVDFLN